MDNDEAQIVTHFLAHESDVERKMLARAAKNASFVRGFLPGADLLPAESAMAYDEGLPFFSMPNASVAAGHGGHSRFMLDELLINQGVEPRMSFGFQNTSGLPTAPGMMRIGIGQESEQELVEKLYGTLMLVTTGASGDHTKTDEKPAGKGTADAVRKIAGDAADKGFGRVSAGLKKGHDPAGAAVAGARKLVKAGLLSKDALTLSEDGKSVTSPDARTLAELMAQFARKTSAVAGALGGAVGASATLDRAGEAGSLAVLLGSPVPEDEIAWATAEDIDDEAVWRRDVALRLLDNITLLPEVPELVWADPATKQVLNGPETGELKRLLGLLAEARKAAVPRDAMQMLSRSSDLLAKAGLPMPETPKIKDRTLPEGREAASERLDDLQVPLDPSEVRLRLEKIAEIEAAAAKEAALAALRRNDLKVFEPGELEGLEGKDPKELKDMLGRLAKAQAEYLGDVAVKDEGNDAWRERMVKALLRAGVLASGDVVRTGPIIAAPSDAKLERLMGEIETADATTPAGLKKKLAVVMSLRKPTIEVESLALSRTSFPSDGVPEEESGQVAWKAELAKALKDDRLTPKADASEYLKVLDEKKTVWRDNCVRLLTDARKTPPRRPDAPLDATPKAQKDHARAMADYDSELRLALGDLDDVNRMHASTGMGFDLPEDTEIGMEARYLPNIVASCAATQLAAMTDDAAFVEMMDVLRDVGLDALSNEARERLMERRGKVALKSLKTGKLEDNLKNLKKIAESFPYGEGPGRLLKGDDLKAAIAKPPTEEAPFRPKEIQLIAEALVAGMSLAEIADVLPGLVQDATPVAPKKGSKQPAVPEDKTAKQALAQAVAVCLTDRIAAARKAAKRDPVTAPVDKPSLFRNGKPAEDVGLANMTDKDLTDLEVRLSGPVNAALKFAVL